MLSALVAKIMRMAGRISDEELVTAYREHGSVWRAGQVLRLDPQLVLKRLRRLGIDTAGRTQRWTEEEDDRLRVRFGTYQRMGRLDEFAHEFGRSRVAIMWRAQALGLPSSGFQAGPGFWSCLTDEDAELLLDRLSRSNKTVHDFCRDEGLSKGSFAKHMRRLAPDRYEAIVETNMPKQTPYQLGRQFEYSARDQLRRRGYFVMRSPASRSALDLVAIRRETPVLFVQCKRSGQLVPKEWNELMEVAELAGAWPVMAARISPRKTGWWKLEERKSGRSSRQPMTEIDIDSPTVVQERLIA